MELVNKSGKGLNILIVGNGQFWLENGQWLIAILNSVNNTCGYVLHLPYHPPLPLLGHHNPLPLHQ